MKVLFISNDPSIFIEGSSSRARMRAYAAAIGDLHILSVAPSGSRTVSEGSLTLHPFHGGKLRALLFMSSAAHRIIRANGIEVVSAQDPFEHGWIAREAARGTSCALHVQVHTDFLSPWFVRGGVFRSPQARVPSLNRFRRFLAARVLPHADGIRVVSKRIRDSMLATYGTRIREPQVLPIVLPGEVPAAEPLPPHRFTFALITVGRLEPEKRIADIFYAIARLGHQHKETGLIVVGDGSERPKLEALAKRLGLSERIVFTGWLEGATGSSWGMMRSAQAYIQASAYEGYGRTLIEAALARIPIITTDVGIVGDVFKGYEEVLAAPPGDPAALATHIRGLLDDHQARAIFVQAAEKAARAHLSGMGDAATAIRDDMARAITARI